MSKVGPALAVPAVWSVEARRAKLEAVAEDRAAGYRAIGRLWTGTMTQSAGLNAAGYREPTRTRSATRTGMAGFRIGMSAGTRSDSSQKKTKTPGDEVEGQKSQVVAYRASLHAMGRGRRQVVQFHFSSCSSLPSVRHSVGFVGLDQAVRIALTSFTTVVICSGVNSGNMGSERNSWAQRSATGNEPTPSPSPA